MINLDEKKIKGTQCVSLFTDRNTTVYVDSFLVEYVLQEVLNQIRDKSITHNKFKIQDNEYIMCRLYCIEYMLAGKT